MLAKIGQLINVLPAVGKAIIPAIALASQMRGAPNFLIILVMVGELKMMWLRLVLGIRIVISTESVPTYAAHYARYNLVNVGSFTNDDGMDGFGFLQSSHGSGKRYPKEEYPAKCVICRR